MKATGVYWIPVFEVLDQRGFDVVLVNARDAKHVPGRKTDLSDAQWLRQLHEYGLPRASFRPKGEVARLRECQFEFAAPTGFRTSALDPAVAAGDPFDRPP